MIKAVIPEEPERLVIVLDKVGDAWQKSNIDNKVWRCVRDKVPATSFLPRGNTCTWRTLVLEYGPLVEVLWADAP